MLRPVSMMAITHPTCDPKKKPMKYKAIYKTRCVDIEILNVGGFDLFIKHRLVYSIVEKELLKAPAQRIALPALGWGRRSRPARKMLRRVKLLGMCAESPASGARFVRHDFIKK